MKKLSVVTAVFFVFFAMFANILHAQLIAPQGRLTLATNTPVMTADVVNATTIYYTPYQGNTVPVYNSGTSTFSPMAFSQFQLNLSSSYQTQSNIYDLFIGYGSPGGGAARLYLCAGPAWSSLTSRGTSAALTQWNGLWVNASTINCYNQAGTVSGPAAYFDYVGSVYMTGNGETAMQFQPAATGGGTNNFIALYNAYNRVKAVAINEDNTTSWSYGSTTLRPADNSTSNRISFLDGLQQSFIDSEYQCFIEVSNAGGLISLGLDSTTTAAGTLASWNSAAAATFSSPIAKLSSYPLLGLHYVQALESGQGTTTAYFGSTVQIAGYPQPGQALTLNWQY